MLNNVEGISKYQLRKVNPSVHLVGVTTRVKTLETRKKYKDQNYKRDLAELFPICYIVVSEK